MRWWAGKFYENSIGHSRLMLSLSDSRLNIFYLSNNTFSTTIHLTLINKINISSHIDLKINIIAIIAACFP